MKISPYQVQNIIRTFRKNLETGPTTGREPSILKQKMDFVTFLAQNASDGLTKNDAAEGGVKKSLALEEQPCKKIKNGAQKFKFCVISDDIKSEIREFSPEKMDFPLILEQRIKKRL